ncbi:unnamed protein product [Clonostachys rosea f. rosea IK726]|uniref:VIT domain-containing protein n=2 Tax=Bionectria ochroleuca TaxID=29856 RepID=A0A0B7KGN5_BIOOC|nr:unnamed protein product [Clonostachys rosea f. rosea IK726]
MLRKPSLAGGCYIIIDNLANYLPQVEAKIQTTILDSICQTNLTQTFINPSQIQVARDVKYIFPLHGEVSIVGFTCCIGNRVIKGAVKESREAQADFGKAKAQGKTAALFQRSRRASDIFSTNIGNLPAGGEVRVELTYLEELKHDAEINGLRLTIPTRISPRYGSATWETKAPGVKERGMSITVDVEMPRGSVIRSIQSPSHPMSVAIGTLSTAPQSEPALSKASASFSQSSVGLDIDVVIDVVATNLAEPAAFLETHPTIPNQRALMMTLVPRFNIAPIKPEIVFLCDRSGSMRPEIKNLMAALHIFLRSLPAGVKFNICSFGTKHTFLWERSKAYDQVSFEEAKRHIESFEADYGGTNIFHPLEATFEQRYSDMNLEVFVLTDGRINDQDKLFDLIHKWTAKSNQNIRVFSLGVGLNVSSALVEGIARAGNGFAQTVHVSETMDKKVIRMLKGALLPHIKDYSLDIKYGKADAQIGEDFEIIESVSDSLLVHYEDDEEWVEVEGQTGRETDPQITKGDEKSGSGPATRPIRQKHTSLPAIPAPDYIQVPSRITQVFPFNRTTTYVLLSNQNQNSEPKSVILKGSCDQGPLELEIPIVHLSEKSSVIHQMAARKEIRDLEENRGWLSVARDDGGKLLREQFRPGFSNMAKREAVRLGVLFQVVGKWCSFVAVEPPQTRGLAGLEKEIGEIEISRVSTDETPISNRRSMARDRTQISGNVNQRGFCAQIGKRSAGGLSSKAPSSSSTGALSRSKPKTSPSSPGKDGNSQLMDNGGNKADSAYSNHSKLQSLIALQGFGGCWGWSREFEEITKPKSDSLLKLDLPVSVANRENSGDILATACAIAFLKKNFIEEKEIWDLIAEKGQDWLKDQIGGEVEGLMQKVSDLI